MAKKKIDLGRLTVGATVPKPAPAPEPTPVAEPVPQAVVAASPPIAGKAPAEFVSRGVQMRPEAIKMLRYISVETGKKQRELVSEALNLLFERYHKAQVG